METIKTDRLIIRLAIPDDAESIYSYRSDFIENKYQEKAISEKVII